MERRCHSGIEGPRLRTFVAHTAASQTLRRAATTAGFHHFLVKGNAVSEFDAIVEHLLIDDPGRLRS